MVNFISLLLCVHSVLCLIATSNCWLRPYGRNVKISYEYYYVTERTTAKVLTLRRTCTNTCSSKFLWWCTDDDRVCRTIYYHVWKTLYKRVRKRRSVYICEDGWIARGSECTIPVCPGGCRNDGVCISPKICQCAPGWTGSRCGRNINECKTNQNKCEYKAGCINTQGSYRCGCSSGFSLKEDRRRCKDIDECSNGQNWCGPNTTCLNSRGSYSCPCITGYTATLSRNACEDIDECSPSSGIAHGCQMKCNNLPGGYSCSCYNGYYITSNGRECSDHDECEGNAHGCEQRCLNLPGGYKCACSFGYKLNDKDLKTCDDINECSENISGCAQNCENTIGGLKCSCKQGYRLGKDLKSCFDIDECSNPVDYCHHECLNTPGSYRCTCRQGFDLHLDGKSCMGRPCFPIYKPVNGMKNCSGYRTEDSCNFDCLPGYGLSGSMERTCGPDKQWTGNMTECKIKHCSSPNKLPNGFVYSPCSTHYGSQCLIGCNYGYYSDSKMLTCVANGLWKPSNVSCKEIKVCQPNPCLRGGICSVVSEDQYTCECTDTGYTGTNCDIGFFKISDYPTISHNILSPPITVVSSPPTDYVILNLMSPVLKFSPSRLIFDRNSPLNQSFRITAQEAGYYIIRYSLSGPDVREFNPPEEDILFVNFMEESLEGISALYFPFGCYKKLIGTCPGSNVSIVASSTSPFVPFGPLTVTQGVVAIEIGNSKKIPLSLLGVNLQTPSISSFQDSCNDNDVVSYSTESLLKSRTLAKSFTNVIADSLPTWIKVTLSDKNLVKKISSSEVKTHFLTGMELHEAGIGDGQPLVHDMFYSLLTTRNVNVTIQNDADIFKSNALSLAVELCGKSPLNIFLRPSSQEHNAAMHNISILKEFAEYGWHFKFYSLQFSKRNTIQRLKKGTFWDGQHFFDVEASSDGTFAVVSSLKKNFGNTGFADIRMQFDGTLIGHVKDINQIIDSPLHQQWSVDLYGRIGLTVVFKMEGESVELFVNGPESVGYANFGGYIKKQLLGRRRGFYFNVNMDKDPFVNTSLRNFVDMKSDRNISCFLNITLYKEKHRFYNNEITDSLSCAFRGTLKVGILKFPPTMVNLLMGKQHIANITDNNEARSSGNAIELYGTFTHLENATFGIFKRFPESCMNVRFSFAQNTPKYEGSFCAICKLFGMEKLVNVRISYEGLKFQVFGKLHDMYDASMDCSSRLLTWENQVFDVEGKFETNAGGIDFVTVLKKELDKYVINFILQATKRIEAADQTVKSAYERLEKILLLKKLAFEKLQQLSSQYTSIAGKFETARSKLKSLEVEAEKYSKDVKRLKSDLDSLCKMKQCPKVCHQGTFCSACYEDIIANSMGICPATCFRTEQQLIPPYSEVAYCERENCKRVHNTNGFFKSVLGETLASIVKTVLSFGITFVATAFGAPPPVAGGIASGITTLLDTGRVDEILCSVSSGFLGGAIGGKGLSSVYNSFSKVSKDLALKKTGLALVRKGIGGAVKKAMSCQRDQKDGHWKCNVEQIQCRKERYEYEYTHIPYKCKQSCVIETIKRTIEKSCCQNVSCASFVVNVTCVAENVLCKKARVDALEKISKTKSQAENILKNLEYARSNFSYWNLKKQKMYIVLLRQHQWFNTTQKTVNNLEKASNSTIKSKNEIDKIFSTPLRIKSLLNKQLTSVDGIRLEEILFKTKVDLRNDNSLLPLYIAFEANGTLRHLSTVFDFERFNTSLKSISEEILIDIIGNFYSNSRKKRSVDPPSPKPNPLLSSLKKYHNYCAKFTNYHGVLHSVALSLYNLTSEVMSLHKVLSPSDPLVFNITNLIANSKSALNQTMAFHFSLEESSYSRVEYYKYDLEMSQAFELREEQLRQNYEVLNSTNNLLVYNWLASMEDLFNSSRLNDECSGMNDCMVHILVSLVEMLSSIEAEGADHMRQQIKNLEAQLDHLSNTFDRTIADALKISSGILTILKEMSGLKVVCAQSPNITKHPNPITEMSIGNVLVLECKATGTALIYSWSFNGQVLQDQSSNLLTINGTTISNSGNYTCFASNHIAKERSTPAVVIIHPPPIIIHQPVEYLTIVLSENNFLHCEVEDTGVNISYQWWFKSEKLSSTFTQIYNETFSYLDFSPMTSEQEGRYFCQMFNSYGVTLSRISFVKAISFTLPVPMAVLSFILNRETRQVNSSVNSSSSTGYDVISSNILRNIWSEKNSSGGVRVKNLHPINCQLATSKSDADSNVGIYCSWEFQYIGSNMTSNRSVYNDFKVNSGMVINATQEISERIERFVKSTKNGSFSFSIAGDHFFSERNNIAVHKFSLICPRNQVLVQTEFKCVDCPPGYHAAVFGTDQITICIPCPLGFYQPEAGKTNCSECPKGFTTWHTGSRGHAHCKVICEPGHYGTVIVEIGYCFPCPLNEYQPHEGKSGCVACPSNHVTQFEGATNSKQCILEATESPNTTVKTTDVANDEIEGNGNDNSYTSLIFWLLLGVLFVLFIGIVVAIITIRKRRTSKYTLYVKRKNQKTRLSHLLQDGTSGTSDNAKTKKMDNFVLSSYVHVKKGENDEANRKQAETISAV